MPISWAWLPRRRTTSSHFREKDLDHLPGDIDFEPDAESVMHYLMRAYLRNTFYYALIDSAAAEQGARTHRNEVGDATTPARWSTP